MATSHGRIDGICILSDEFRIVFALLPRHYDGWLTNGRHDAGRQMQ